ncbi:hypothetical protein BHE74_00000390 [Ensete ventricosum]|nr:hypothetical protein BHE74_00000390 [Ensete ventricosum]
MPPEPREMVAYYTAHKICLGYGLSACRRSTLWVAFIRQARLAACRRVTLAKTHCRVNTLRVTLVVTCRRECSGASRATRWLLGAYLSTHYSNSLSAACRMSHILRGSGPIPFIHFAFPSTEDQIAVKVPNALMLDLAQWRLIMACASETLSRGDGSYRDGVRKVQLKLVPFRARKVQLKLVPLRERKVQLKLVPLRERKGSLKSTNSSLSNESTV